MARIDNINNFLTDVADSIRTKTGKSNKISASSFDTEIASITTSEDLDAELATYNTELTEQEESLSGIVEYLENKIESGEPLLLQDKSIEITENGTTNIVADEGYDGLNSVEVITNVGGSGDNDMSIVFSDLDNDGYPTSLSVKADKIPNMAFQHYSISYTGIFMKLKTAVIDAQSIGQGAFRLVLFENLILSDRLNSIGQQAFENCQKLTSITFPNKSFTIGNYAFQKCKLLNLKKLPDVITVLGNQVFGECTSLTQMSMNVTEISKGTTTAGAFIKCTGLKAVWFGSKITSAGFGRCTFYNSPNLKKIFIDLPRATVEAFANYSYAFSNNTVTTDVIVCNDDEGFMTQDEFDAIDWSTYEG